MINYMFEKAKVNYKFIDAEENVELTKKYKVKQAPTLVIVNGNDVETICNLSNAFL